MTQEHPITPSSELVEKWYEAIDKSSTSWKQELTTQAARWGADQELEACCEYEATVYSTDCADGLRRHRRPEPPSLKGKALDELRFSFSRGYLKKEAAETIRRALEALDD